MKAVGASLLAVILAGVAGGLAVGRLHLPLWLAALIAVLVFVGAQMMFAPGRQGRRAAPWLEGEAGETAQALIEEGERALASLRAAVRGVQDRSMRADLARLADSAERVLGELRADPGRAMAVRRLLTFYLPNAAGLAEGWRTLEGHRAPSPERMSQVRSTVQSLIEATDHYADEVTRPRLQALDLDLKVLNDALKADLEKPR